MPMLCGSCLDEVFHEDQLYRTILLLYTIGPRANRAVPSPVPPYAKKLGFGSGDESSRSAH